MKVSVIIPACNREKTICDSIKSVVQQTFAPHEIIVVDDASADGTVAIVRATYPDVRILSLSDNGGAQRARAEGIRAATGDWIAFLDSDDIWMPQKLEWQRAKAAEGFAVVHGSGLMCWEGKEPERMPRTLEGDCYAETLGGQSMLYPAILALRECFDVAGLPDPAILAHQEWDLTIALSRHFTIGAVDKPLFVWRVGPSSMSANYAKNIQGHAQVVYKWWKEMVRVHGSNVIYKHHLFWGRQARKYLTGDTGFIHYALLGAIAAGLPLERAHSDIAKELGKPFQN